MINRRNYTDVQEHLDYRRRVHRDSVGTLDNRWSALRLMLAWADERLLSEGPGIRPTWPAFLARQDREGEHLAVSTVEGMTAAVRSFYRWAIVAYPRRYRPVTPLWLDSLRAPDVPDKPKSRELYTVDDVRQLVSLDDESVHARRVMAAAAMLFLSGMRAGAFVTLPIEAVDVARREIRQWTALGVKTKFSKTATTYLLDIPDLIEVVAGWDRYVRQYLPPEAMWYPNLSTDGTGVEAPESQTRNRAIGLRTSLRWLCAQVGLEYLPPHHFRHGHVVHAEGNARTMADRKAISQNVMHSDLSVTDGIYGRLTSGDLRDRVGRLGGNGNGGEPDRAELIAQMELILRQLKGSQLDR